MPVMELWISVMVGLLPLAVALPTVYRTCLNEMKHQVSGWRHYTCQCISPGKRTCTTLLLHLEFNLFGCTVKKKSISHSSSVTKHLPLQLLVSKSDRCKARTIHFLNSRNVVDVLHVGSYHICNYSKHQEWIVSFSSDKW